MAEWPFKTNKSKELYERACKSLPGGVSCGLRAVEAGYEPYPLFIDKGKGSRFWDVDGNEYIDYLMGDGTLIHGHCPPKVIEAAYEQIKKGTNFNTPAEIKIKLAEKIKEHIPSADLTIFTVGGTDSVAMALRIARGYTGKEKIIKFEGHYHGYNDYTFFDSYFGPTPPLGSERAPEKIPWSWGIPEDILKYSILVPWHNLDLLEEAIEGHAHELAAVICEPIPMGQGVIPPEKGFLEGMRKLTERNDIVLIFDEVLSGFRVGLGGAQELYGVNADLVTLGKSMGGGFPIAAVTGKEDIMQHVKPGEIFASMGTYAGNTLGVAASYATITELSANGGASMKHLDKITDMLWEGVREAIDKTKTKAMVQWVCGAGTLFFTEAEKIRNHRECFHLCDQEKILLFWKELLKRGIYWCFPYGYCHEFTSTAHTEEDAEKTISAVTEALKATK